MYWGRHVRQVSCSGSPTWVAGLILGICVQGVKVLLVEKAVLLWLLQSAAPPSGSRVHTGWSGRMGPASSPFCCCVNNPEPLGHFRKILERASVCACLHVCVNGAAECLWKIVHQINDYRSVTKKGGGALLSARRRPL